MNFWRCVKCGEWYASAVRPRECGVCASRMGHTRTLGVRHTPRVVREWASRVRG